MTCSVQLIADSVSPDKVRLTTLHLRYWRAIHSEFMTHRVFSRNASSSRAIPVKKMLSQVWNDPAGPIHWGSNQPGMQASTELQGVRRKLAKALWKFAGRAACIVAYGFIKIGLHKQVANRILEPWQYIHVVVTSTEWDNFFALRRHPDAQPEIKELADAIYKEMSSSSPKFIDFGEWHIPYVFNDERSLSLSTLVKISTARCARTSYKTFDGEPSTVEADVKLHDKLVVMQPLHASPAEHQATPINHGPTGEVQFHKNFRGWRQYRDYLEKGEKV